MTDDNTAELTAQAWSDALRCIAEFIPPTDTISRLYVDHIIEQVFLHKREFVRPENRWGLSWPINGIIFVLMYDNLLDRCPFTTYTKKETSRFHYFRIISPLDTKPESPCSCSSTNVNHVYYKLISMVLCRSSIRLWVKLG